MKTSFFKQGILAMGIACCMQLSAVENPVDYVNTLVGTQSKYELSTGNTYPATAMPWGYELLDSPDRRDGERLDLPLRRG